MLKELIVPLVCFVFIYLVERRILLFRYTFGILLYYFIYFLGRVLMKQDGLVSSTTQLGPPARLFRPSSLWAQCYMSRRIFLNR